VSEDPLKNIHPEWRDIISSLDIKNIESSPFGAGLWAKLFDDVQVVYGLNNKNIEPMLRSLKEVMDEPQNLMEKFCGKHPINIVKVNNWANTGISIPSDIGLPIYMEVQMPSVLALRGEVEIDCSGPLPSVSVELGIKADTSFNGYVGTVCPFTMQIVAAGIHQQWSVNYPTMVSAKIEAGKLQVKFSQNKDVKPSTTAIDVMSYSVRPYATIKPIVYDDITPVISHKNTKMIKSQSERKTKSLSTFGQLYGVDTKVVINTETDIADTKNLLDSLSLYKYNPVNMVLFSWTSTAVASNGMPSARFHQIEMVYNPSTSSTKEIEIDLTVAMAHKYKSKGIKSVGLAGLKGKSLLLYQELQGSVSQEHQKLKQVFEKIQVDSGLGFTSALTIVLKGDQERTFSYVVSAGQGLQESKQKWNLHLENKGGMSVCVDGSMILPSIAIRDIEKLESNNIEFNYSNVIGFGQTCQEHTIKVSGRANVSEEQKERIHQTVHKCIISSEKANKIRKEVHDARIGSQEQQELETHQSHVLQKKIKQCEEAFKLMSTLDQAKFTIEYTPMPELVRIHAGYLNTAIKAVLFPYVVKSNRSSTQHNTIEVDLQFKTHLETVDMTLMDEDGSTIYANIRLPERIQRVLPLIASQSLEKQVMEKTLGGPMFPKCYIGDAAVITFDNKTYSYELDDCYHVLVADCSPEHTHSILGKVVDQKTHLQVFNHRSLTTMEPASSYSSSRKEYRIVVDGQPIVLRVNQKEMVQSRDGESTFYLHRTYDNAIVLETQYNRIIYDGLSVEIESLNVISDGKHCGLCGDKNNDKRADVKCSQSKIPLSAQQAALSFRVQKDSCSALSADKQALKQQQQQWSQEQKSPQQKAEKSPVSQLIQGQFEKCTQRKHSMIRQGDQLCISQIPIVECGSGCSPKSLVEKTVSFACLPVNRERVIRLYQEKVNRGELLPELRNMEKTFTSRMEIPIVCNQTGL